RDSKGAGVGALEQHRRLIPLRDVHEVARNKPMAREGGLVAGQASLVLDAAFDKVEDDPRQPPLGHPAQILDIDGLIDLHRGVPSEILSIPLCWATPVTGRRASLGPYPLCRWHGVSVQSRRAAPDLPSW